MYGTPKELTIATILGKVSQWDLWRYYLPGAKIGGSFKSPLRKDESPSASLFIASSGDILLKDFRLGTFNIWTFLQTRYHLTFHEVLMAINNDFNLHLVAKPTFTNPTMEIFGIVTNEKLETNNEVTNIQIKKRNWNEVDCKYWGQYGLDLDYLTEKKVIPLDNFWVNGKLIYWYSAVNPAYSYEFGKGKRKIYMPLSKKFRFLTNAGEYIIQGIDDIPQSSNTLIITKAYKDVLLLDNLGYHAIAPQSESTGIPVNLTLDLLTRFRKIYLLYDNDETGRKYSNKICGLHPLIPIFVPEPTKDITDYRKIYGSNATQELIKTMLYETS